MTELMSLRATVVETVTASPTSAPTDGPGADYKFISAVRRAPHAFSLMGTSDAVLIASGKEWCHGLDAGLTFAEVRDQTAKQWRGDIALDTVEAMIKAAIGAYCPADKSAIGE